MPPVTHAWRGIMQNVFLHKSFIKLFTNFMGKIHAKVKKGRCLLIVFVIGYEYHQYIN